MLQRSMAAALLVLASGGVLQAQIPQPPQLPPQALADFEGILDVQYEDSQSGARLFHYLNTTDGRSCDCSSPAGLPIC